MDRKIRKVVDVSNKVCVVQCGTVYCRLQYNTTTSTIRTTTTIMHDNSRAPSKEIRFFSYVTPLYDGIYIWQTNIFHYNLFCFFIRAPAWVVRSDRDDHVEMKNPRLINPTFKKKIWHGRNSDIVPVFFLNQQLHGRWHNYTNIYTNIFAPIFVISPFRFHRNHFHPSILQLTALLNIFV